MTFSSPGHRVQADSVCCTYIAPGPSSTPRSRGEKRPAEKSGERRALRTRKPRRKQQRGEQ